MSVLVEMRRYLGVPIFVGSPELNTLRISGRFQTGGVDQFLARLSDDYGIVVDREDGLTILRTQPAKR
jgi:ferric-dicitrate binding protein FerR (iron transport regulator)